MDPGQPNERQLPSKFPYRRMRAGETIRTVSPGGGGYGDPFERDPAAVLEDVRQEKMSLRHAFEQYGVVISAETLQLDAQATRWERDKRRRTV